MQYELTTEVSAHAEQLTRRAGQQILEAVIVIGGERAWVCDEAIVARTDSGELVGMSTIAPRGESGVGVTEIVGVFVLTSHQRQGIGYELLRRALERCVARGFTAVRLTAVSRAGSALVSKRPSDLPITVEVLDFSQYNSF